MRVIILNLPEATSRLSTITEEYPSELQEPLIWAAKRGNDVAVPDWWHGTKNCWAHVENFIDIYSNIKEANEDTLLLEDDTGFASNFTTELTTILTEVPQDWDYINLGALHNMGPLYAPVQISNNILRLRFSLNSNAVIVTPTAADKLETWLEAAPWGCRHSTDERIGGLFLTELKAYAPLTNICCQRAGASYLWDNKLLEADSWCNAFYYTNQNGIYTPSDTLLLKESNE